MHQSDHQNLDAPIAELLPDVADDKEIPMETLFKGLPQTKKNKNLKKSLTKETTKKDDDKEKHKDLRLPVPLSTPQHERVERAAIYERAKADVASWDAVVHSRRAAQQLHFPLQRPDMGLATARQYSAAFKPKTPMEEEIAALLHGSKSTVRNGKELSEREESAMASMTMQEAIEKRGELSRLRALQSYQEAKLRRQNKIKSRKFRKITRKTKEKEKQREMDELQKTNPELAIERMAELDKTRVMERASLKHRNSSKFLQMQSRRARYNKEVSQLCRQGLR